MEEWVDVIGYPGYRISNTGFIWSNKLQRVLISPRDEDGYERIELYRYNIGKKFFVHRLVALHFIPNPENKPTVNHIDGEKLNNDVSNLEWATVAEQNQHKFWVLKPNKNIMS